MKQLEPILARYRARIEEKERELAALRSEMNGIKIAYDAISTGNVPATAVRPVEIIPAPRAQRSNVKQTVLDLLRQVAHTGLNAATAVELAATRNETIQQSTVSSLLSRFKSDGAVVYDGSVYKLKEFAASKSEAPPMH